MTSINFLLTISICCQEKWLWELIKWSLKRKCFDLLSNSLNYCNSLRKWRSVWRIICGYWDLKVNEYLNKQEIQLDGCKLVDCYQKLPRRCTLTSHAAVFVSLYNTPLITMKPSEKITDIPGGGVWQVQHSTMQGDREGALCGGYGYFLEWHIWT